VTPPGELNVNEDTARMPFALSREWNMADDKLAGLPTIKEQLQKLAADAADGDKHDIALDALRALSQKPGVKTTEFYVSLLCGTVGTVLQFVPGKEVIGACLLGVATLSYNLSRGLAKQSA
jgi:hypothetical protein